MEEEHQELLKRHFTSLVEQTDLKALLPILVERGVFLPRMIENYKTFDRSERREFYTQILRRGPRAFDNLVDALYSTGHWELTKLLSPKNHLNFTQEFTSITSSKKTMKEAEKPTEKVDEPTYSQSNSNSETEELLSINVIRSTEFKKSPSLHMPNYYMKSKKRGICLFVNIVNFSNNKKKYRAGAEVDKKNLEQLFNQIGITFQSHADLTKNQFSELLSEFSKSSDISGVDCIFIIISSHGENCKKRDNHIMCSDGLLISVDDVIDFFNTSNCPALQHIPKIFIFQMCRGDNPDLGYLSSTKREEFNSENYLDKRTELDGRDTTMVIPTYSDMLIVYSTTPGFASCRDIKQGSWFFISMCKIFMKHAHDTHLEDLFKLVDDHLRKTSSKGKTVQNIAVEGLSFNKHCYLNPGLFKEQ